MSASLGTALLAPHSCWTSGGLAVTVGLGTCGRATTTATATSRAILLVLLVLLLLISTVPSIPALWWGLGVEAGLTLGSFSFPNLFDFLLAFFEGDGLALGFGKELGLWLSGRVESLARCSPASALWGRGRGVKILPVSRPHPPPSSS